MRSLFFAYAFVFVLAMAGCGDTTTSPDAARMPDLAATREAATAVDQSMPTDAAPGDDGAPPDLATSPDLTLPDDLTSLPDLAGPTDLPPLVDLAPSPDLALPDFLSPDLAPSPDLTPPPDLTPSPDLLSPPDLAPTCSDGIKNGNETDVDCGGSCKPCAASKMCLAQGDCQVGVVCKASTCQLPVSCGELNLLRSATPDGSYKLSGTSGIATAYCDMTGGGWTLVANQVPGKLLPDTSADVNLAGLGTLDQSYRVGNPTIKSIVPTLSWRLTDASNKVYLKPSCKVDWTVDYLQTHSATDCTTGYTATDFKTVVNGGWVYTGAHGIGINNSAQNCSIRMYNSLDPNPAGVIAGAAADCIYNTSERVSLWYK